METVESVYVCVCVLEEIGRGVPNTEQYLVIGRLSEDRGYCSPREGSQLQLYKQHTLKLLSLSRGAGGLEDHKWEK